LRSSKRSSMETMEEERDDEDVSDKHLVYNPATASHHTNNKNTLRNDSRRSLSRSRRHADDSSKNNAAAAAIAAALQQIKKSQHSHETSRSINSTSRPHRRDPQFTRKVSRSVSPLHKSRYKSSHRPRQSSSFHLPSSSHDERSSVRSFHSSSSSSFSSYDRNIAKNYPKNQNRNVRPSSSTKSRRNSFTTKQQQQHHRQQQQQQMQHKSSSDMAICPDNNDRNASPSSPTPTSSIEAAFQPLLDNDGCCIFHPFIQLKMKLPSGTWRTLSRCCVVCREEEKKPGVLELHCRITTSPRHVVGRKALVLPSLRPREIVENVP
jgi:hypothetical protein